jgi:polyphenol oxidase
MPRPDAVPRALNDQLMILPQPSDGFEWECGQPGPRLWSRALLPFAQHFFTTRTWRLGVRRSDGDEGEAWEEIERAADVKALARVRQVHGTASKTFQSNDPVWKVARPEADIMVSDDPQLLLAIETADCVPLLFADRRRGVVAAAHAGWRGLAAGVPGVAVGTLATSFGSRPEDLVVAVGPSIGPCCYEVGPEVRRRFEGAGFSPTHLERWFYERPQPSDINRTIVGTHRGVGEGHWFFDPAQAACDQLAAAGLAPTDIHVAGLCTASHSEVFCSYRRDGPPAGRMAAVIRASAR